MKAVLASPAESQAQVSCGATLAQIASLPTSTVPRKRKRAMAGTGQDSTEATEATSCPICMDDYKGGEKLCTLPCSHVYHFKVNRKRGEAAVRQSYTSLIFSKSTSKLISTSTSTIHFLTQCCKKWLLNNRVCCICRALLNRA